MAEYADLSAITRDVAEIMRPPRRISVSEAAHEVVRIEVPGGYTGPWDPTLTPYMVEPADTLKSRTHEAVVFVSPARTGKTQALLDGWLAHMVTADPGDAGFYFSTQNLAYDYRKRRVERLHKHSPRMAAMLSARAHDTTIETVTYRHGMILNLGWPTSSQLAQRDLRYVALSDYDSFPDDVGGEGSPFDLARKRIQVAMSAGMALVESSPKRVITQASWTPDGPHAAPPVDGGILSLYNRGDRRRWYWRCLDGCGGYFEAPALPAFDETDDVEAAAASAHVGCPHCGAVYRPKDKRRLNASGLWVPEGGRAEDGRIAGDARKARIASFWLLGCAAAFQSWQSLVRNYLLAKRTADQDGDETALITTTNTDQGLPYRPRSLAHVKGVEYLAGRREPLDRYHVPDESRVLFASVDVQANRFEVAVWAYGPQRERWLIDRFALRKTLDGGPLMPAAYLEHWEVLTQKVVKATYRTHDGRLMHVRRVAVDSGGVGQEGGEIQSTRRAYDWWRGLRRRGIAHRVHLVKGAGKAGPPVRVTHPDTSARSDRNSGARGDVPVLALNTDVLKDSAYADLQREIPGPGYLHVPDWLDESMLGELVAEQRTPKGWIRIGARRNETWDLLIYADAVWLHERGDKINWESAPSWAAPLTENSEVVDREKPAEPAEKRPQQPKPAPRPRRTFANSWKL